MKKQIERTSLVKKYEEEAMGIMVPTMSNGVRPNFATVSRKVLGRAARVHDRLMKL